MRTSRVILQVGMGLTLSVAVAPGASARQVINSVTCNGGPCRQPVELINGRAVTIALTGQTLNALVSAIVTDSRGRPIGSITAQLGAPALSSGTQSATMTRNVTVMARDVETPLTGLRLHFATSTQGTVTAPIDLAVSVPSGSLTTGTVSQSISTLTDPGATTLLEATQPKITTITPDRVHLAPGSTATVALQGTNLSGIRSVRVVRNGATVSNVTAQLQASSDPTRRNILLSAAAPSSPPWNVPLSLELGVLPTGFVQVQVDVQVVVPDLVISSFAADPPTAEYVDLRYMYRNQGAAEARFGSSVPVLQLVAEPTSYGFPKGVGSTSGSTVGVGGGAGGTIRVYLHQLPGPGTYKFTLFVDRANQIAESNESNNQATVTLQLAAPPRPDAIIESVSIIGQPGRPTGMNVLIRNKGQGTADFRDNARLTTSCTQLQQGVPVTGSLAPAQSVQKTFGLYNPAYFFPTGSHTCRFTLTWHVDYTGGMIEPNQEFDGTNNDFSFTFVVPEPDLSIRSITTSPSPVTQNASSLRPYSFRVEVVNRGPGIHLGAPSNAAGREPSQFIVSSGCTPPIPVSTDLYPAATTIVELPAMPNVLLPGSYRCEFRVQSQGPDGNTSNNALSYSWTVRSGGLDRP